MGSIGIFGAGTWGTALAGVLANAGHEVTVWSILPEEVRTLSSTRRHKNLPNFEIPETIRFTGDIREACEGRDILLFAVPSTAVRATAAAARPFIDPSRIIVDVAKGIEPDTLFTMSRVLRDELGKDSRLRDIRIVALSGPTHAEEVAQDLPTTIVSASEDQAAAEAVQEIFSSTCMRVYTNTDVLGVEICGALKNVIALAAGISAGLGYGDNTKAALITRGLAELSRLGLAMGCREQTFSGLAGMGDLIVTATSRHSRNNRCGYLIGQGYAPADAVKQVGMVVEGINALPAAVKLAERYGVEMPITKAVEAIVDGRTAASDAVGMLMGRARKTELLRPAMNMAPEEWTAGKRMDYPAWKENGRIRLMIIVGTRPEIIRLSAVIKKCRQYFDTVLVHTGQNYDYSLNGVFFRDLGLADPDLYLDAAGADLGETMGRIIASAYKAMAAMKPEAVLVLGDTNSCLSVIGAKRLHIPIFHMEAGNRCKDECLPEETNRRIVDIISDVNMAYSEHARRYLADCGLPRERTFVTGSPMAEVLTENLEAIRASDVHQRLGLEKGRYILLSAHREENIDTEKNFTTLFTAINKMAEKYDMPILYSCHPRSRKRLESSGFELDKRVIAHEPLGFHDYNCLQMNAFCVVSDSGTLPEESSFYTSIGHPIPAVCIRTSTERPEALDKGCFVLSGIDTVGLLQSVDLAVEMVQNGDPGIPVPDYADTNVSDKVVRMIQSYVGVVNKMVWRKTDS